MCGYCLEAGIALELLERERRGEPIDNLSQWPMAEFHLQEAQSPLLALTRITQEVTQAPLGFSLQTLLCKAIEVLITQGFESLEFQGLLRNDHFKNCLANACSYTNREEFSALAKRFGCQRFDLLYDEQTFMVRERAESLREGEFLQSEALGLLRHYIRWWLQGKGLQKNDLHQLMKETGILDPIRDVKKEEQQTFGMIFRALWASIFILARAPSDRQILLEIITHFLGGVPLFDAHDLWLQRRAALLLYDAEGLDPFLKKGCRGSLLYYLDIKRGLSTDQMKAIAAALDRLPKRTFRDDFFDIQDWLAKMNGRSRPD